MGMLALAAPFAANTAFAQTRSPDTIDPAEMLSALDAGSVDAALAVVTVNAVAQMDEAGNQFMTATVGNGLTFEIHFASCEQELSQACKAMYLIARWDAVSPDAQEQMEALANNFQMERPIVSTGFLPDGKPYLLRFVIADYGIQQGNVLSEFSNFIQNATDFHNLIGTEVPLNAAE
ncbi:hypothetical protein AAV99_12075 [Aurantiacibacter marinus]|uniref:YbjN domain-containing protein n=2 Tax=Aurantiacibacter marinus TaxID=874156 RepID=A0A0H0XKH7_9SPHN|nr:hypothetical protein AAV99_12075 [Aurantiacibacter marinus]